MKVILKLSITFLLITKSSFAFKSRYDYLLEKIHELSREPKTELITIGKNSKDTDIMGIRINQVDGLSHHLIVGGHHGNELISALVPIRLAELIIDILSNPNHPQYHLLEDKSFSIIPVLNISGYNNATRREEDETGIQRDPNRDYPDPCSNKTNFYLKSTENLAQYVFENDVISAITIHGYIGTFTYPWGIYTSNYVTNNDSYMKSLSEHVSDVNNYRIGTHGGLIYPTVGAFEDWAYHEHGIWSFLLEIAPNGNINLDALSLLNYLKNAPKTRAFDHGHDYSCKNQKMNIYSRP